MRTIRIENIPDFLRRLWKEHHDAFLFRGQACPWPLVPSIARWEHLLEGFDDWRIFQDSLINEFAKYGSQHLRKKPKDFLELLINAQHHGVPTCLLDFSLSPLKALYFAVFQEEHDNSDGAFWSLTPKDHLEDFTKNSKLNLSNLEFFLPRQINYRLVAQQGCFAAFPMPQTKDSILTLDEKKAYSKSIERIQKWFVPAKSKKQLRIELALIGIRPRTMFPDLDGVALDQIFQLKLGGNIY